MAVELAAVRVQSPWFGASTAVWTNVIGVVLLALSIGYLIGARASRSAQPQRALGVTLSLSAIACALVPVASGPIARIFLPPHLTLEQAGTLTGWGSLAASVCLFLPAATALGCTAPLATEILARGGRASAGSAGGRVLCASTLGSLLGTFATTYSLVPNLGTTRTFLAAGIVLGALALLAFFALGRGSARNAVALVALILPCALWSVAARLPDLTEGDVLLASRESTYQSVRIVERTEDGSRLRHLQVNESFDSFQSVWSERPGFLPDGHYYNLFAFPLWWSRDITTWRVGVVGLGGGTAWRVLDGAKPTGVELSLVGAEIDPAVVALAREWMDLSDQGGRCRVLSGIDGRALVAKTHAGFELLILDAYANQTEIPPHLSSVEFFEACRASLVERGWLVANVGGFGFDDPVVTSVGETLATAFGTRVLAVLVPYSRNVALFARRGSEPIDPLVVPPKSGVAEVDRQLAAATLPGLSHWFAPTSGVVLTDDLNPIQTRQHESIERAARRGLE